MMNFFSFLCLLLLSFGAGAQVSHELPALPQTEILNLPPLPQSNFQAMLIAKKYNHFLKLGVPAAPLKRSLEFLVQGYGRTLMLKGMEQLRPVAMRNDRYLAIADYSQPSTEKRFYLLDLKNNTVERHYVAHGKNTGGKWAQKFSNNFDSKQTSLGFYLTGELYESRAFGGTAMKVYGMEATNYNAYARYIVVHQADYATEEFIEERRNTPGDTARLGRSHGCFALDPDIAPEVINKLKGGALIYSYTKGAEELIAQASQSQELSIIDPRNDEVVETEQEERQVSKAKTVKATPAKVKAAQVVKPKVKTTQTR